jgi:outer membrane receptor protein involved in Fe transport
MAVGAFAAIEGGGCLGAAFLLALALPAHAEPAPSDVQGVVVNGKRPPTQVLIDRTVYAVGTNLQATNGTAADILNEVPSVDVDADGNVSLRGDPNVTVLIDGKPSAQFSGPTRGLSLQQLPASEIDRVEVMSNPPAQYKAEGSAGVINIVTKKTRKAGLSGAAQLSVGDKRRFVANLSANEKLGKLDLSGSLSLRQEAKKRLTTDARTVIDPASGEPVMSRQTINEHFLRLIPQVKAGADYDLSEAQSFGVELSHRELAGKRFFNQYDQTDTQGGGTLDAQSLRHSNGHEWAVDSGESAHLDQKLWRPGETLTISFQRSRSAERERYFYTNTFTLPAGPPAFDDLHLNLDLVTTEASADYVLPMRGGRSLKLGYDYEFQNNHFDDYGDTLLAPGATPAPNPLIATHFRYRQQVNTAYGELELVTGPWDMQTGVRLEQTDARTLLLDGAVMGGESYFRAYPSLHVDRALGADAKLSLSVSRRVNRPDPEALSPFVDRQDTHNLRAGNPKLLPQDTWSYELGYNVSGPLTYGLTGYYRFDRDSVTDVTQVISADVVLATKENLPKSRSGGLEFNANSKLLRQLSFSVSGNAFYTEIDATALGATGLRSTTGLNGKASLDWRPTQADTAQISFSRTDRRLTPQGSVSAIDLVNLGYKRQLRSDLALVITVSDAIDGQKFTRRLNTPTLQDAYRRYQIGQIAYVGLLYTFGSGKKAKESGFEYEQ